VIDYMPSPLDAPFVRGRSTRDGSEISCPPDPEAPLCALAFKLHADAHGDLTFVRIYSGTIEAGAQVWNPRTERIERVARLLKMHANARSALASAGPGEVAAVTGLKFTGTGDTLCARDRPLRLEGLVFPDPVISLVLEPRSTADRDNLRAALERIAHEDPSFHQREDEDTGQWLVQGMGELHLEVVLHRLKSEHKIDAATGAPRVAYREALRKAGRGAGRVDKVIGGKAVFGALQLEVLPAPEADTIEVEWGADCPAPPGVRGAVTEALKLAAQAGPRFGYPLVQARVLVSGGESRPQQDSEAGFVQAALMALRQAMGAAQVGILEPVMAFEIQTPSEFASGVIADLNGRRAEVEGIGAKDELRTVTGKVPLAKMFGYSTAVRSLSQGRASFSMQPSGFAAVPEEDLHERGLTWA
jgi:elongation factor G